MQINHTYDIAEESGNWYIIRDGDIIRNVPYRTARDARRIAEDLTKTSTLWTNIFTIETRIAEAFKNTPWPYGATCVNHGTDTEPSWLLTEPYRVDDEAVRVVNPDPTGHVQVNVYTRDLYETACRVVGIEPDTDESISEEYSEEENGRYVPGDIEPIEAVKMRLAYRRAIGIHVEDNLDKHERFEHLKDAGLLGERYTRKEYETACKIMGSPILEDRQVLLVVTLDVASDMGIGVLTTEAPYDSTTINLSYRRAMGIGCEDREKVTGDDNPGDK